MQSPNFKLGWFIPNQVAALTHFHGNVTTSDFMGIVQAGQELLNNVENEFHVLIDNRVVDMSAPARLSQMKQMVPFMKNPWLRYERLFVEHETANFYGGNFWGKYFNPYIYASMRYIDNAL